MPTKDIYAWKKPQWHHWDWYLELFSSKEDADGDLPFMTRRPGINPHSLVLNLNHPAYDENHAEIEFYHGAIWNGHTPQRRGYAVFRLGSFVEGVDFLGNQIETLREFRGSLNHYFLVHNFQPKFGEHLGKFLANSNLDEKVRAAYAELMK